MSIKSQSRYSCLESLHKTGPVSKQLIIDGGGAHRAISSLLIYWILVDSGRGEVIVFGYIPTDESTKLQRIVSNPWPHRET